MTADLEKIASVAALLRKRAAFFSETDPATLDKDDFGMISNYLRGLADALDHAAVGDVKKTLWIGVAAFLLYVGGFIGICLLFNQYNPLEAKYYAKLSKEIFADEANTLFYAKCLQAGVALIAGLFIFFVSFFMAVVVCSLVKAIKSAWMNSAIEAGVTLLVMGVLFFYYYKLVYVTDLAKKFL